MPPLATTVVVPLSVPPLGLVPMAIVIEAVLPVPVVTRLLFASKTRTVTAGVIEAAACVFVGCCPNTNWVARSWCDVEGAAGSGGETRRCSPIAYSPCPSC